jgi:hypothetical protein
MSQNSVLEDVVPTTSTFRASSFRQNRYIFYYLGLDVRSCCPSLSSKDAFFLIKQMKNDPKFAYDYLIENNATIVDPERFKNVLSRASSKSDSKIGLKKTFSKEAPVIISKTKMCKDLFTKDNKLTNKEIANHVGCDISLACRATRCVRLKLNDKIIHDLLNYIKSNFNGSFSVDDLALSYNNDHETNFKINDFNKELKKLSKFIHKKGNAYSIFSVGQKEVVSVCVNNFISKRIKSNKLKFSLDDLASEYSDVDSRKLKKAIQNWSYFKKIINGFLIKSNGKPGNYILFKADQPKLESKLVLSTKNIKSKIHSSVSYDAIKMASSLHKLLGKQNAIELISLIESLKNE